MSISQDEHYINIPFHTKYVSIVKLIMKFRKITINEIDHTISYQDWVGCMYSFQLKSLIKIKQIVDKLSDEEFCQLYKFAIFCDNTFIEQILSRILLHRLYDLSYDIIKLRRWLEISIGRAHMSLYANSVKSKGSFIFSPSQKQIYVQNCNGDYINNQLKYVMYKGFNRITCICKSNYCEYKKIMYLTNYSAERLYNMQKNYFKRYDYKGSTLK